MTKYIYFISVIILMISCRDANVVVEETKYFSFERPATLAIDWLVNFEQSTNVSAAQKAIGNNEYVDSHIKGEFIIDGISIHFVLKNPKSKDIVTCYCSDYSDEYLKRNGEFFSQNSNEYRIVEGKNNITNKHWIELCIDMKHQFFIEEVNEEKYKMIKKLLKTIRMKTQ